MKLVTPTFGGYADVVAVDARLAVSLDTLPGQSSLSLTAAAVGVVNATTAYVACTDVARVQSGNAVLVHGGTGALGNMLGQMSRHLGAREVIATVGHRDKIPLALDLGYARAVLRDGFQGAVREIMDGRGVDVVLDTVGGSTRQQSLDLLTLLGRLVLLGNSSGADDSTVSLNSIWLESRTVAGLNLGALSATAPERFQRAAVQALTLIADGTLQAHASRVYPLENASEAHRELETGRTTGTLLLAAGAAARRV